LIIFIFAGRKVKFYITKYYIKANEEKKEIGQSICIITVYQFDVLNHLQCFDVSTRDGIPIEILEELVRISENNNASLKEECLLFFINSILEKERWHKYEEPNIKKIQRPKFLRDG